MDFGLLLLSYRFLEAPFLVSDKSTTSHQPRHSFFRLPSGYFPHNYGQCLSSSEDDQRMRSLHPIIPNDVEYKRHLL